MRPSFTRPSFGSLPFLGRLSMRAEQSPATAAAAVRAPIDPDLAPIGPPALLPRAIVSQVLIDATQLVPAWAMPRTEPAQATTPTEPKATKRARPPKATDTSTAKPTTARATTAKPTTARPTTARPTTARPTTVSPTAAKPRSRTRKRDV